MPLQVNTEVARRVLDMMDRQHVNYEWDKVYFSICTRCAWVGIAHEYGEQICQRPPGEFNTYSGDVFGTDGLARGCPPDAPQQRLPQTLSDALWSALRLGGTNGLIDALKPWDPEMLGWPSSLEAKKMLGLKW